MKTIKLPEYRNISICLGTYPSKKAILNPITLVQWTDVPEGTENVSNAA
jgi:hypothetical protein